MLTGVLFLAVLFLGVWGVAVLVSGSAGEGSRLDVNLGDDEFNVGSAEKRAAEIAERGPALFPGLLGPDEGYIIVNHVGTDPDEGWVAFAAVPEGAAIECAVAWNTDRRQLVDPCTDTAYPPDGTGLTGFPVVVNDDGDVVVDLTPAGAPGQGLSTSAPTTTRSTIRVSGASTTG